MWGSLLSGNEVTNGYSNFAINDWRTCAEKCESHSECVVWMVIYGLKSYHGSRSATCYLKTGGNITIIVGGDGTYMSGYPCRKGEA